MSVRSRVTSFGSTPKRSRSEQNVVMIEIDLHDSHDAVEHRERVPCVWSEILTGRGWRRLGKQSPTDQVMGKILDGAAEPSPMV